MVHSLEQDVGNCSDERERLIHISHTNGGTFRWDGNERWKTPNRIKASISSYSAQLSGGSFGDFYVHELNCKIYHGKVPLINEVPGVLLDTHLLHNVIHAF